jgi:hypothetical protein
MQKAISWTLSALIAHPRGSQLILCPEDLGEKDVVGLVLGFEAVATDGAVG